MLLSYRFFIHVFNKNEKLFIFCVTFSVFWFSFGMSIFLQLIIGDLAILFIALAVGLLLFTSATSAGRVNVEGVN
jgi:hypothetical protein